MKKTISLLCVLVVLISWYPLLVITGWINQFTVTIRYPLATFLMLTVLFSVIGFYLLMRKEKKVNTIPSILTGLLTPLSVVNLFIWVWVNRSFWVLVLAMLWVIFALLLMYAYGRNAFLQGAVMGGSMVILIPVFLLCLLLTFFTIGQLRVVQSVPSPDGTYYAEVIDDDQGALGGNTLVEVYDTRKKIDLFFLSVQKNPQRVYFGRWGMFKNMKLEWESEQVLLINGVPHEIN